MQPLPAQSKAVPKLLYSCKEGAQLVSLSLSTFRALVGRGVIASRKMGSKRLIPHAALIAFAQKNVSSLWVANPDGKKNQRSAVSAKQMRLPFEKAPAMPPQKATAAYRAEQHKAAEAS